jgi:hypothetical protein
VSEEFHSLAVATVAECLVGALATATEGNTIADFVDAAVRGFDWNTTPNSNRAVHVFLEVFDKDNGWLKLRLKRLAFIVPDNQTPRRAVASLVDGDSLGLWIVRLPHKVPDSGTRKHTKSDIPIFIQ